jgi:hypothetical protein
MNAVAGDISPEMSWAPKLASVHLVVELAELVFDPRALAERLDQGETAVALFDVGVEPSGVGPLRDEQPLRTSGDRASHQQRQRHGQQSDPVSSGEIVTIITSTVATVSTAVTSWADRHGQRRLEVVDVVGNPAEHLAALPVVEVGQRQPVQLVLDIGAQRPAWSGCTVTFSSRACTQISSAAIRYMTNASASVRATAPKSTPWPGTTFIPDSRSAKRCCRGRARRRRLVPW